MQFNTSWWTVSARAQCTKWAQYSFCRVLLLLHPSWSLLLLEVQHTNTNQPLILLFLCLTLLCLELIFKIPAVLDLWPEQQPFHSYKVAWKPFSIYTNLLWLCRSYSDVLCGVLAGDHTLVPGSTCHPFNPRWIGSCIPCLENPWILFHKDDHPFTFPSPTVPVQSPDCPGIFLSIPS